MSEQPNEKNIFLKIVSEDISVPETEQKSESNTEVTSIDGYTQPNNDVNLLNPKTRNTINRFFEYYIKKLAERNKAFRDKKKLMINNITVSNDVIQNAKQHVKTIIHGGAGRTTVKSKRNIIETNTPEAEPELLEMFDDKSSSISPTPSDSWDLGIPDDIFMYRSNKNNKDNSIIETTLKTVLGEDNKIEYTNKAETNTKQIILLHFENDTFKPVIKIDDQYIEIINKWYKTCEQTMDIEDINISIPNDIEDSDIDTVLYKNINCEHKDLFVKSYFPEILNNITLQNKIKSMKNKIYDWPLKETNVSIVKKKQSLSDLNIIIPKNMVYTEDYFYMKGNNKIVYPKYKDPIFNKIETSRHEYKDPFVNKPSFNEEYHGLNSDTKGLYSFKKKEMVRRFGHSNIMPQKVFEIGSKSHNILTSNSCQIIDGIGYACYNAEYNILKPPFGISSSLIEERLNTSSITNSNKLIIVLINIMFLQTIVISEPDLLTLETIFKHGEYGFIELFTFNTDNNEIEILIQKQFNATIFNNREELNQTLLSTSQIIELIKSKQTNTGPLLEEEQSIKNYLQQYFEISDDADKKMKASTLYDMITLAEDICDIDRSKMSGFRNRLSKYLKDIGLQKIRYDDGYYYYGIVSKEPEKIFESGIQSDKQHTYICKNIEEIKKERNALKSEVKLNDFFINLEI